MSIYQWSDWGVELPPEEVLPPTNPENSYRMDWTALEEQLQANPVEARIVNPTQDHTLEFPLEITLKLQHPTPIPCSTVSLLLRLCPEAVVINHDSALYEACCSRSQQDPRVIRAILNANPALAAQIPIYLDGNNRAALPIHYALRLPCAAEVIPDLIRAHPNSLSTGNAVLGDIPLQLYTESYSRGAPNTQVLRKLLEEGHRDNVGAGKGGQVLYVSEEYSEAGSTPLSDVRSILWGYREQWEGIGQQHPAWYNICLCLKAAGAFRTGLASVEEM